jgi:predicted esterase
VAAVLSAMLEQGALPPHIRFDFAVLISGFLPRDPRFSAVCDAGKIGKVRSLHVVGKADDIVEPDRSMRVLGIFSQRRAGGARKRAPGALGQARARCNQGFYYATGRARHVR